MILPTFKEFERQSRSDNLVPVWTTVPADLLTPVSAYLHLTRGAHSGQDNRRGYSFLLESVEGGENVARYTYMGSDPFLILRYRMTTHRNGSASGVAEIAEKSSHGKAYRTRSVEGDIAEIARRLIQQFHPVKPEGLPPFSAGAVGYMTYNLISLREPVPLPPAPPPRPGLGQMPDAILMFFSTLLVFDHVKHQIVIIRNVRCDPPFAARNAKTAYDEAVREIRRIEKKLNAPLPLPEQPKTTRQNRKPLRFTSNVSKPRFLAMVRKAKEHILAGDIFQVVLSQRLETSARVDAFEIYRALRQVNPAPYLFFFRFGEDCILGSSPEMLVKVTGDNVEYRPIAGTRARGNDPQHDMELERELISDEKERAEHVMLVDLGRNDVGRVSRFGTVEVSNLMFVERYSHVMHLVSSIRGKLRKGLDAWDTLWACFPAGTVSGAPKVRAMQIISDLEPARRGVYAGTVLYFDFSGNLNSCIAIRSIVVTGGKAYVQVGAGIVADSVPEREYEETINKGRGMLKAIEIAQEGR
ncbi:MAG: anthranilate synthase component I [Acidobacteria bacterium]|nr:anthranilate synthase component I [Acidobacteriota bacterium]